MKFEYASVHNYKPVIPFLNELGQQGWFLVQQYKDENLFLFVREIVEEKDETV